MTSSAPAGILAALGPSCRDNARRQLLLGQTVLNGIDYVEFESVPSGVPNTPDIPTLHVHFLNAVPVGAYGLVADPSRILVLGGARIVGVTVTSATVAGGGTRLDLVVDQQGDFSAYLLAIGWRRDDRGNWVYQFADLDRLFSVAAVNFRPGCPVDFDCAPDDDCPPGTLTEPALDYLSRDYASFRQLLIDLVAQRSPTWLERSPADLGITLLELFATEGDHLAYLQDAVANEAYLDTARQRESAKRHAKLVDYQMHDGRNAQTWVNAQVDGQKRVIPAGVQLVTRISAPLRFDRVPLAVPTPQPTTAPPTQLHPPSNYVLTPPIDDYETDPALAAVRVFETMRSTDVDERCNELQIHTWGNEQCCLPIGATTAHVYAAATIGGQRKAIRPPLKAGDLLLLEEVRGPESGAPADADPTHRQVVEIVRVSPDPSTTNAGPVAEQLHDRLYLAALAAGDKLTPAVGIVPVADTLPLVEVAWRPVDALRFPLCLSTVIDETTSVGQISVARGNILLADHGRTVVETVESATPFGGDRLRIRLERAPLTMACNPPTPGCDTGAPVARDCDPWEARPALGVEVMRATGPERWCVVRDLLSSDDTDNDVVVDVDDAGRPVLRFGDGDYGRRLVDATSIRVTYRIGNGRAGSIGADGIAHIVIPDPLPAGWPISVLSVRNPLPATGGVDAETIEEVRQHAPAAFRATQFRAVTAEDYRRAALTVEGVAGAVASFRWTGSWYTVYVGVDPADPDMILTDARGQTRLAPSFRKSVVDVLDRYRLAGYDLEVRPGQYVPLDITISLCLKPGFFRGDVVEAVLEALAGRGRSGQGGGLFDAANLTFAQPVYLSHVYAAVQAVEGVDSADVLVFRRHGRQPEGELEQGFIPIGAWEIAQLDNDPSRMENGSLIVTAGGGS